MKTRFIFNPCSGRNRRRPGFAAAIRDFISARGLDADLAVTDGPGHATQLAREAVASGHEVVVAVGGDGTMNEVAQGLVGTPTALALVPCGSGNGLALHVGLPLRTRGALDLAAGLDSRIAAIDTGSANGKPFFNAMGLGLDADISHRFNRLTSRGLPAYVRTTLAAIRSIRTERCEVHCGTRSEQLDILLLAVANSDQYGNNARIAPGASVNDGLLDLVAVGRVGLLGAAVLGARLFAGNIDGSAAVRRMRGSRFTIERMAPGLIHTDGETHLTAARIEIVVRPASLRLLVPAGSRVATAAPRFATEFALHLP